MPEDSGSKYNPSDTLCEETIVNDVDEEALMEAEPEPDIEIKRPKANKGKRLETLLFAAFRSSSCEKQLIVSFPLPSPTKPRLQNASPEGGGGREMCCIVPLGRCAARSRFHTD